MEKEPQTHIVISHRDEEKAFMLRLFFALKGFKAEIQKSIDHALFSSSHADSGTVVVCDASDQTLLRARKKTGGNALQNVVVMREEGAAPSGAAQTEARVIPATTVGQDLLDVVSDCSERT